jgi:FkbM family methyltransferase
VNVGFAEATRFFEQRHANYEKLADAIKPHLPPDGVLFDIGANIGYFSMVVGERTGFRGAAHLFEPIPHLAQFCSRSLANAEFSVAVHQYGLSDTDGHVDIFIDTLGNFGWNTMIGERARNMTPQRITVRRFEGIGLTVVPSVVKIDVEGAEYLVLRGLLPALKRWDERPPILCEIGWGAKGHPNWDAELAVFAELAALGYRATTLEGEPVVLEEVAKTCDVLFLAQ